MDWRVGHGTQPTYCCVASPVHDGNLTARAMMAGKLGGRRDSGQDGESGGKSRTEADYGAGPESDLLFQRSSKRPLVTGEEAGFSPSLPVAHLCCVTSPLPCVVELSHASSLCHFTPPLPCVVEL